MKLSELLDVAIPHFKAYDKLVQEGTHEWCMGVWLHNDDSDAKCEACLAGAVLYGMELSLAGLVDNVRRGQWMDKIDNLRVGQISAADVSVYNLAGQKRPLSSWQYSKIAEMNTFIRDNFDYRLERAPFEIYEHVAEELKEAGL